MPDEASATQPATSRAHPPSLFAHVDGIAAWPDKPTLAFEEMLKDEEEKAAYTSWALKGTIHPNFAHLLPRI